MSMSQDAANYDKQHQSAAANSTKCIQEFLSSNLPLSLDLSQLNQFKSTKHVNKSFDKLQNTQGLVTIYRENAEIKSTRDEGQSKALLELTNTQRIINDKLQPLMKKILIQEAYNGLLSTELAQVSLLSMKNRNDISELVLKVKDNIRLLTLLKYLIEIVDKQSDSFVNNAIIAYQIDLPKLNPFTLAAAMHNAINVSVLDHKPAKMVFVNLTGVESAYNLKMWKANSQRENFKYYTFIPFDQCLELYKFNSSSIVIIPVIPIDDKLSKFQLQFLYNTLVVRDINKFNPAIIYLSLGNNDCFTVDFEAIDFIVKELVKVSNNKLIVHCQDYNDLNTVQTAEGLEQQYLQMYNCILQAIQNLPFQQSNIIELQSNLQRTSTINWLQKTIDIYKDQEGLMDDDRQETIIQEMQQLKWNLEAKKCPSYSTTTYQSNQQINQHQQEISSCTTLPYYLSGQLYHIKLFFENEQILFQPQSKYIVSYEYKLVYLHNCYTQKKKVDYNYAIEDLKCFYIRCDDIDKVILHHSKDLRISKIHCIQIPTELNKINNQQIIIGDDSICWIYGDIDGKFNDQIHVYQTNSKWTTLKRADPNNWNNHQVINKDLQLLSHGSPTDIIQNRLNPSVCTESIISTNSRESFMLIGGENTKCYKQMNIIEVVQIKVSQKQFSSAIINKQNFGLYHSIRSMPNIPVLSTVQNGVSYILILPGNKNLSKQPYSVLENQFTYENAMLFITDNSTNQITQHQVRIKLDREDVPIFSLFNTNQWNCQTLKDRQENKLKWKLVFQSVNYKRGILKKNMNNNLMNIEVNSSKEICKATQSESQEIQQSNSDMDSTSPALGEPKTPQIQANQETPIQFGAYFLDDHQIFTHCYEMNISLGTIEDVKYIGEQYQYKYECSISLVISEIGNKSKFQQTNLIDIITKEDPPS